MKNLPKPISQTRQYKILLGMKQRCYNPNSPHYDIYGGRGIGICDEWLGREGAHRFYEWSMSHGYADDLTIDRVNNDLGYMPGNCIWITGSWNACKHDLASKLVYIIENVPTFEAEYLDEHINSLQDEWVRKKLRALEAPPHSRKCRARLSDLRTG